MLYKVGLSTAQCRHVNVKNRSKLLPGAFLAEKEVESQQNSCSAQISFNTVQFLTVATVPSHSGRCGRPPRENLLPLQARFVLKETVFSSPMNDPGLNQPETLTEAVRVVDLCYCSCMAPHFEDTVSRWRNRSSKGQNAR